MDVRLCRAENHIIRAENKGQHRSFHEELSMKMNLSGLPKFKGTENPLVHIRAFKELMFLRRVERELWPIFFPLSLEPAPLHWFYSMDPDKMSTFERIVLEFSLQYYSNIHTQASQTNNLPVPEHAPRTEAIKTPNIPPTLTKMALTHEKPLREFTPISNTYTEAFQRLYNDKIPLPLCPTRGPPANERPTSRNAGHIGFDTSTTPIENNQFQRKEKREFTNIEITYAEAFQRLTQLGIIEPIGPTADPATKHSTWNANDFCLYHRGKGHNIEKCFRFKHKLQDLIDQWILSKPQQQPIPTERQQPSNQDNLLPHLA